MTAEELQHEVSRLRPLLVQQARGYVQRADDAEDIVQDALLRLCVVRQQLRAPIDAFASVLVRNLALNHLRRWRKSESLTSLHELEDTSAASPDDHPVEQLLRLVSELPPRQQLIIRLHDLEGMDYQQIASLTGRPATALRKSASRIRMHLRLRYLAAISAAVALLVIGTALWRQHRFQQFCRQYEGSYTVVGGQRNDDLRQIRPQIEQTLADASQLETALAGQTLIEQAERNVLQSIDDPAERRRIEQLLGH